MTFDAKITMRFTMALLFRGVCQNIVEHVAAADGWRFNLHRELA